MDDNTKKILDRIKNEGIHPIPKWKIQIRQGISVGAYLLLVILGGIAVSIIIYAIQQSDFLLLSHISHSQIELILALIPLFWIIFWALVLAFSLFNIGYLKKGYKLTLMKRLLLSLGLSLFLGTFMFLVGGGQKIDQIFSSTTSLYQSMDEKKIEIWSSPEMGLLSGIVISKEGDTVKIKDFSGKTWEMILNEDVFIPPRIQFEEGEKIKVIGEVLSDRVFEVEEIRPWGGLGRGK